MLWRIVEWWYQGRLTDEYLRGWRDGVDQQRVDPDSCAHHITDSEDW